jgi:hypothetical protein
LCAGWLAACRRSVEEVPVVRFRMRVTAPTPLGAWGDVCPETVMTGISVAVAGGAQDGPKAFAAERREVPT